MKLTIRSYFRKIGKNQYEWVSELPNGAVVKTPGSVSPRGELRHVLHVIESVYGKTDYDEFDVRWTLKRLRFHFAGLRTLRGDFDLLYKLAQYGIMPIKPFWSHYPKTVVIRPRTIKRRGEQKQGGGDMR